MKTSLKNHLARCLAVSCLLIISTTYAQTPYILGGLETTSMTRIVPDKILFPTGLPAINNPLGNWEPYTSVLGTSTFLIVANTYAEGTNDKQRYRVAFQPAAGGPNVEGEVFYADDGTPFTTQINRSRQDGNPGRVAGDARRGATNFMVGGEASPNAYVTGPHSFGSDGRWSLGLVRPVDARFATVQTYSLNPGTLTQTMLSKAQDSAYGRDTSGDASASQQYTRFGGDMVALDNGNFVSVVEDRSTILSGSDNAATATIFAPDGTIVKERFMVAPGSIWGNVAPFLGGFCVRVLGVLHFFDNDGNEMGTGIDQATALDDFDGSPLFPFSAGDRGDDQRIAGHINSPYVFMAQRRGLDIYVAAFDSRLAASGSAFVGEINVNELEPAAGGTDTSTFQAPTGWPGQGRVKVAVDALNRVAVASQVNLTAQGYGTNQVVMRVLKFDLSVNKFTYLTHSFVVFLNASTNANNTAASFAGNIAMTTKQICIAAKGQINLANNPNAAADSPGESNFYTVLSHPEPQEDPTKWAVRVQNPEADGLAPRHGTVYVNANSPFNYGNPQFNVPFVDISADHTALVSFGDQSTGAATDFKSMNAVWALFDDKGNNLISPLVITNQTGAVGDPTLTNNWLSFYRADGTPTPGNAVANGKVRANHFGNGILFGARADRYGLENPAFSAINTDASSGGTPLTTLSTGSGFPAVQLLNNNGSGVGVLSAVTEAEAQATGSIPLAGMEYLANGNIVVVSESRQDQELVDRFGGTTPNRHVVYTVITPAGVVVKPTSLASSTTDRTEAAGFCVGVTSNGFALRFSYRPRHTGTGRESGTIRIFDINGNPLTPDINQADTVGAFLGLAGPDQNSGCNGRGDAVGFHGNGVDAYVNVCVAATETLKGPVYVTVYNADGTVRWHRPVADLGETNHCEQVDGAIAADGRVLVAIDDHMSSADGSTRRIVGKMFDATGKSMGPLFYVSEIETASIAIKDTLRPRMAWRDSCVAYVWRSLNGPGGTTNVIGYRMFADVATAPPTLSIAKSGTDAVITWPATAAGYTLRSKASVTGTWETNSPAPVFGNGGAVYQVTEPIGSSSRIYQLIR